MHDATVRKKPEYKLNLPNVEINTQPVEANKKTIYLHVTPNSNP